ncbi:MAG: DsbC family protein [Gammaproteobacteria bacterium]|nr:DsbC family protein [Gammaproteobacteria bacterium]MDD9800847.1 DsbC family protein [Gammaproteobacteria bacterium]MDD9850740.1 DsbC family protein [Gammaproteobacteria bacterium]MDD9871395.1 DsbC family protein [Gammaproteobacteria bacterium]
MAILNVHLRTAVCIAAAAAAVFTARADTSAAAAAELREKLEEILPLTVRSLRATGIPGVYLLSSDSGMFHIYDSGGQIMIGEMFDKGSGASLLAAARGREVAARLGAVPAGDMIVFGPKNARRYVTVFTDIDCGYCRLLHQEMDALGRGGLQVRYLAFPRTGIGSESYDKAVSVWCAADRNRAMTEAKTGRPPPRRACDNPVADQFRLGQDLGVRGTPAVYLDDGTMLGGYLPAAELLRRAGLGG